MNISEFTKGQRVIDTWWPEHKGVVVKLNKNSVHILFPTRDDVWKYDKEHAEEFLRKIQ